MIVVLDFDGVLNGIETREPMSPVVDGLFLNEVLVAKFNRIVERTGAKVVLSTSWRKAGIDACSRALRAVGFIGEIIGATPDFRPVGQSSPYTPRSDEIRAWLAANPVDAFVVLDDHDDCEVDGRTVQTDTLVGLTDDDVERAVKILEAA